MFCYRVEDEAGGLEAEREGKEGVRLGGVDLEERREG